MTQGDHDPHPEDPISLSGRTVAGRYRVVGMLGEGGIGKVYEAEQIGLDRQVAVKVIQPKRRNDPVTTQRFLREARAAGRISSPHVVTLFDCGTDDGTGELYIAMEMLLGQSLLSRLADGEPMELPEVLRVAASIARGLAAAHDAGVLHRDLKPANIFLCADGNVKVLDFGIAKLIDDRAEEGEPLTQVNRVLGTPMYMSPEAATRRPVGPSADLYAVGLLIYEMVVGAPPFRTGNAWKTLEAQVKEQAPPLGQAAPWRTIPEKLERLVQSLLHKRPEQRPQRASDVAATLDELSVELKMQNSAADRTEVEVRLPEGVPEPTARIITERPPSSERAPELHTPPPAAEVPAQEPSAPIDPPPIGHPHEEDELMAATTVWAGSGAGVHPARSAPPSRPTAPTRSGLNGRGLWLAAAIVGVLVFAAVLVVRIWF